MALELWVDFFSDLQDVRGRARNTVLAYRRDLELYSKYSETHDRSDFEGLYQYLQKQGLSARSQARVVSSLRTYFKFLETRDVAIPDIRGLRPPKVQAKLPKPITMSEFEALFEACRVDDDMRTARNQLTLLLLLGLGCRVTELVELSLNDYNETEGWVTVMGKGGKQRIVPLTSQLLRELSDYLSHVRPEIMKSSTQSVLINDRGKRPSRVDIWRWLSAWSKKAGFAETISPHKFRHGCATQLLEAGADLRSIQILLGHSSIQTTQIYTSVSRKSLAEAVDKNHPLSELDGRESELPLNSDGLRNMAE